MKKSLITHIVAMVIAVALGSILASYLEIQQSEISINRDKISKAPLGGFNKFASDVQWMLLVNYSGRVNCNNKPEAQEVYKRLNTILANDPDLEIAYNMGGMMISNSEPVKSAEIFMRGANNPNLKNNWKLPFQAGFVLDRYVTDKDDPQRLKKAEEMFRLAASRADQNAPYITSYLLRTRAKKIAQNGKWAGIPVINDKQALLCTLFDEWRKGSFSEDNLSPDSLNIPNIKDRLLKAAQEAKASDPNDKNILETINKVIKVVSEDQHLCGSCLAAYSAGDKFCSNCGTSVIAYSVCPKCVAVLKGTFCSNCGSSGEKVTAVAK